MKPTYLAHQRSNGLRRLLGSVLGLLLIVYVLRHPGEAAEIAHTLFNTLNSVVESIITFIRQAAGGAPR